MRDTAATHEWTVVEQNLRLNTVNEAVDRAFRGDPSGLDEVALLAANAMPAGSSDFDRGMAAGMAMARLLQRERDELD